jgi:predicted dienelactone hydrolase
VVLSHGFALNPEWYHHLAEHLASHGFVVLAPEHEESDWFEDVIAATVSRPRQVSATIDLAESGVLDGTIDVGRVAVLGHSYGGYTALAAAGGRIHLEDLERRCEGVEDAFSAAYFCDTFLSSTDELATHFGLAAPPVGAWPALSDARGDKGLRDISLPTLLVGGTGDTGTPWDWGVGLAFDHLVSAPVVRVAFEGAEHFVGVTPCEHMPWTASMPDDLRGWLCDDPAWDRREAARLISEMSTAFILSTLADDAEAKAVLAPGHHGNVDGLEIIVNQ